jgi:hypothetical protein
MQPIRTAREPDVCQSTVMTLTEYLFDAKTKKLLWRGSSSDTLSDNSDKNIKNLDKGVEKGGGENVQAIPSQH